MIATILTIAAGILLAPILLAIVVAVIAIPIAFIADLLLGTL